MDAYNYVIPNVIEKTNGVERAYVHDLDEGWTRPVNAKVLRLAA